MSEYVCVCVRERREEGGGWVEFGFKEKNCFQQASALTKGAKRTEFPTSV